MFLMMACATSVYAKDAPARNPFLPDTTRAADSSAAPTTATPALPSTKAGPYLDLPPPLPAAPPPLIPPPPTGTTKKPSEGGATSDSGKQAGDAKKLGGFLSRDTIKDARAHCKVTVTGTGLYRASAGGGLVTVRLNGADSQCVKAVSSSEDWAVASLKGSGTLVVAVEPNEGDEVRHVTVYIASTTAAIEVEVEQAAHGN